MKRLLAATASAAIAVTGTTLMASPAEAAVVTGGLVNVTVVDAIDVGDVDVLRNSRILNNLLNGNDVNVGVGVAAQLCGDLDVAAILAAIDDGGTVTCNSGDFALTQAN